MQSPARRRGRSREMVCPREWEATAAWAHSQRRRPAKRRAEFWLRTANCELQTANCELLTAPPCRVDLLLQLAAIDGIAVTGQRFQPGGDCVGVSLLLLPQAPQVLLDDGVLRQLRGRRRERRIRQVQLALLHVRPTEAVEERRIVGLDLEGALDERHGLVQRAALLGEHVAEIVERARIERIMRDHVAEHLLGLGPPTRTGGWPALPLAPSAGAIWGFNRPPLAGHRPPAPTPSPGRWAARGPGGGAACGARAVASAPPRSPVARWAWASMNDMR